jgi:AcrR family transcriptional regulator
MADISAAAEITRGTLYRYFPGRESLIKALEAAANEEAGRGLLYTYPSPRAVIETSRCDRPVASTRQH